MVAGCGGGSSGGEEDVVVYSTFAVHGLAGQQPDQVFTLWLASTSTFRNASTEGSGSVFVRTLEYSDERTIQEHIDFRENQVTLDTCTIEGQENPDAGSNGGSGAPFVSGGSSVVINTPSGPWMTIAAGEDLKYFSDDLPGPLPAGATLSILGGVFPTLSAYLLLEEPQPLYA